MKKLLITTALKESWLTQSDYDCVFLGEWCKIYTEKIYWEALHFEVIPYHWDDRKKLKSDHDYLKSLYEKVLQELSDKLNFLHGTNETVQYWRIILGPWLITYIPILFDRWEMLRHAFIKNDHYLCSKSNIEEPDSMIACDFSNFLELMQTDSWNYDIYQRILFKKYSNQVEFIEIKPIKQGGKITGSNPPLSFKKKFQHILDRIVTLINKNSGVFFYKSYFPPLNLISLNLALYQLPQIYSNTFKFNFSKKVDNEIRNVNKMRGEQMNEFESFLFSNILKDIPTAYVEEFQEIRTKTNKLRFSHKTIMTANAYWADDVFKIWAAKKQEEGCKLLIGQHGGSFPPLFDTFNHEEDIAYKHITWFTPYHPKHVQLPPNKINKNFVNNNGKFCSIMGFETPRYSYRITAGAISHQAITMFEQTSVFCNLLNPMIKDQLSIRPYPNMGWHTKQRYIDKFTDSVIDKSSTYKIFIKNARILVCTYPQTTFSEAMASGKPTILLYEPYYNEIIPEAEALMQLLKEANIVFNDAQLAAKHINNVWSDVEVWWNSFEVVNVRKIYFDKALRVDHDSKKEWVNFLKLEDNASN
jgi:putative transferase (TIGR04331 family)